MSTKQNLHCRTELQRGVCHTEHKFSPGRFPSVLTETMTAPADTSLGTLSNDVSDNASTITTNQEFQLRK